MIDDQKRFAKMGALVVNHESGIVAIVTTILQSMGMTHIERALDGDKALALFAEDPYFVHFVVCDWSMPGMTGIQLIEKIRAVNATIPILILAWRSLHRQCEGDAGGRRQPVPGETVHVGGYAKAGSRNDQESNRLGIYAGFIILAPTPGP